MHGLLSPRPELGWGVGGGMLGNLLENLYTQKFK